MWPCVCVSNAIVLSRSVANRPNTVCLYGVHTQTHTNVTCIRKNRIAMCNVVSRLFYSACSVSRAFQLIRSGYLGIHRVCMCCVYHIVNKLESSVIDTSCLQSHSHSHSPISRCEKTIAWAIANYDKIMVFSSGLIKCFSGGMSIDPID